MTAKSVVHYGNPILKKKCKPVTDFSNLDPLIDDMFDTMYENVDQQLDRMQTNLENVSTEKIEGQLEQLKQKVLNRGAKHK